MLSVGNCVHVLFLCYPVKVALHSRLLPFHKTILVMSLNSIYLILQPLKIFCHCGEKKRRQNVRVGIQESFAISFSSASSIAGAPVVAMQRMHWKGAEEGDARNTAVAMTLLC